MRLLVIGATGGTGRELVRQALARGHEVRALVRDPAKAGSLDARAEVARGDVLDPASLAAAVRGREAVLSALGTRKLGRRPTTLFSDGTRNLIGAMRAEGARRLVCVTGIGAGESRGHGPWWYDRLVLPLLLDEIYKDKTRQEELIRGSGLDWVIVRPAILTNGPATGSARAVTDLAGSRFSKVSRADVAAFMLDQLTSDAYLGKAPVLSY